MWLIFLTSLNDCYSFHLRELIEILWQVSRPTKTPSTSKAPTMQDGNGFEICFLFNFLGNTRYIKSGQENELLQIFLLNKETITRK